MKFEYDPKKSAANLDKHGISFEGAVSLWDDPDLIEFTAKNIDEPRFLVIGKIGIKYWSSIITYRDEKIRIISVRRSRQKEISLYESK